RRPDRPLRRLVLLVPQDHRADVQRAAREDPLRRLHRRIQPALLPHAAPLRHAAADLHLRPRHRMGADQPPHHDRGLHLRRVPADHVCEPALELPPRSEGRPRPVGRVLARVGGPVPASGIQLPRWRAGDLRDGRHVPAGGHGERRAQGGARGRVVRGRVARGALEPLADRGPAGAGIALWGVIMGLPALLFGTVVLAAAFTGWGRETLRGRFTEPIEAVGEKWPFERLENLPLGMWIFIFGEIAFFGTLFGAYAF